MEKTINIIQNGNIDAEEWDIKTTVKVSLTVKVKDDRPADNEVNLNTGYRSISIMRHPNGTEHHEGQDSVTNWQIKGALKSNGTKSIHHTAEKAYYRPPEQYDEFDILSWGFRDADSVTPNDYQFTGAIEFTDGSTAPMTVNIINSSTYASATHLKRTKTGLSAEKIKKINKFTVDVVVTIPNP